MACLTSVLNSFNKHVTYDGVKSKIKLDKEGASAYEIIKVAKTYGLDAVGYKNLTMNKSLTVPLIAHTVNNGVQHFVVVYKITNNRVFINDPARGVLNVLKEDFNKTYTGIAMVFKDKAFSLKKEIVNKKFIILVTSIILFLSLINIIYSYLLSYLIEKGGSINNLCLIFIFFVSVGIVKELINFVKEKLLLKYQLVTDRAITIPSLKKIINLPHAFYQKRSVGELISKVNDLSYVKQMSSVMVQVLFVNVIIMLISLVFLLFINKYIFLLNILVVLVILLYNNFFYKKHAYKNYDLQIKNEVLNTKISDGINSIISVKNLCKERYLENRIVSSYDDTLNAYKSLSTLYQKRNLAFSLIIFIPTFISLLYLSSKCFDTTNILFITYVESIIYQGLGELGNLNLLYTDFKSSYVRLKSIYDEKDIDNDLNVIGITNILFKNVGYKRGDRVLFKNVNLSLNKGDFVLISGPSGCGKTTLFKMLTRQINYSSKNIFINNRSINRYGTGAIRRSITYVDQKIKFFSDTVLENITLGNKLNLRTNFRMLLEKILKERNIDYKTVIDNTNSNLSGGELMLISLAQTLNNAGDVIIFDETTSQMDSLLERRVLKKIKEDYKDKIIVLISHRIKNLDLFNKVYTFSDKKIKGGKNEKIKAKRIKTN